jgi:nucleoside-diphosphate-sugar epimerase
MVSSRAREPVAVTGCAGFIGTNLVARLLDEGRVVVGVDSLADIVYPSGGRRARLADLLGRSGFSFLEADIGASEAQSVIASCGRVVNLAGLSGQSQSWGHRDEYHRVNDLAASTLFARCVEEGVKTFVHASTSSVYGTLVDGDENQEIRPCSPYGESKASGEAHLADAAAAALTRLVIARLFSVYGPGQRSDMGLYRFIDVGLTGRPIDVHDHGGLGRDFTYVDDVVSALVAMLNPTFPGGIYNVASGRKVSLNRALEIIDEQIGRTAERHMVPTPVGLQISTHAAITKLTDACGWMPQMEIDEGIARQVSWQRSVG